MKKAFLCLVLFAIVTNAQAMEKNEAQILQDYYEENYKVTQPSRDVALRMALAYDQTHVISPEDKVLVEESSKAKKELAEKYLALLKSHFPEKYATVEALDVPWRDYPNGRARFNALLDLLRIYAVKRSAEEWQKLPLGFKTETLEGKSDSQLEKIAAYYAPATRKQE